MLDMPIGFVHVASAVTERLAELLCAPVFVTDRKGIVITSSEPHHIGQLLQSERSLSPLGQLLRIPLQHETETGEVIVGQSQNQETVPPRLAHALVELVINQTVTKNETIGRHDLKNQLIYDLVHGRVNDELETLGQARQLGMDLTQPRAVILIDAADYILRNTAYSTYRDLELARKRRAQVIIGSIVSFFHLPNDTICADLGSGNICVLKASNSKNLDPWARSKDVPEGANPSWANLTALKRAAHALLQRLCSDLGTSVNIGIGRYHPGLQGLAQSYKDAQAALSLGNRLQGQNQVHCLAELGIAAFVGIADEATKIDLAKYLLSPLDRDPELLTTLNTFFTENCCPSSTAKKLSIHRNTLSYRLDKITSLTGLEPRKFDDAVQMRLSILLRSFQATYSKNF